MSDRSYVTIKVGPLSGGQAEAWNRLRRRATRGHEFDVDRDPATMTGALRALDQRSDEDPGDAVEGSVLEFIDTECASGNGNEELLDAVAVLQDKGIGFEIADDGGPPGTWGPSVVW